MRGKKFSFPITSFAGTTPWNMLRVLRRHQPDRAYYLKLVLSFVVSLIFLVFNLYEKLRWGRRMARYQFSQDPVFIIGFNRSGTTLLHNLLCQDAQAGYTSTLHSVFPYCVLSQKWWLGPLFNTIVPGKRPFDNVSMDMDFPQEEEFAMANLQPFSVYNFFLFPREFDQIIEHEYRTDRLTARDLQRWKRQFKEMVVKSMLNTHGTRYVSKNPQNIPRIQLLMDMFPGAHFIFIYRDPYVVVESMYHFVLAIFPGVQLQEVPADFSRRQVARFYAMAMQCYFNERENYGADRFYEVKLEEFMKDQIGGLKKVYDAIGAGGFEESVLSFKKFLSGNPREKHAYEIHPETIRNVNELASDIVKKLGYPLRDQ